MKNSTILFAMASAVVVTLMLACKTDLDVNASYKNITIVYALLNKDDDTAWIKINKAFLGSGNAFQYAQVPDSNEYADAQLHGYIEELNPDGSLIDTLTLHPKIVDNHLPGIFYGPQHKLYYFRANGGGHLDPAHRYRLKAVAKGNAVQTETALVQAMSFSGFVTISTSSQISVATNGGYGTYDVKWRTGANGKRFDVSYQFIYDEITSDPPPYDSVRKSFTSLIGTRTSTGIDGGELLSTTLNGGSFYQAVHTNVLASAGDNVIRRHFIGVDLLWAVAGPDLYTYLQLSNPISGIVEERPDYSNVQGGYGLFSSRLFDSVSNHFVVGHPLYKQLNPASLAELIGGQYTGALQFVVY